VLALRPLQVNPPSQFLNLPGGVGDAGRVVVDAAGMVVDGATALSFLTEPQAFGATTFAGGEIAEHLAAGELPASSSVDDPEGWASAAAVFKLALAAGGSGDVVVAMPLGSERPPVALNAGDPSVLFDFALRQEVAGWRERLDAGDDRAAGRRRRPRSHAACEPRLHPGQPRRAGNPARLAGLRPLLDPRRRADLDGADPIGPRRRREAFAEWFAGYQFASGRVPCCVDGGRRPGAGARQPRRARLPGRRGGAGLGRPRIRAPDVAARRGRDGHPGGAARRAADRRRGDAATPPFLGAAARVDLARGLLRPAGALLLGRRLGRPRPRGRRFLAGRLGLAEDAARLGAAAEEMRREVLASMARVAVEEGIDYLPASADLADFDPTSTTVAVAPLGLGPWLPQTALEATFWRYLAESRQRAAGTREWDAYTPYELRSVGTLVRLGWREAAWEMLRFFLADRRPSGWRQWAEVVGREPRAPRFLGDMPHTWCGSDFIRSALDLLAYEDGDRLVLAAGVPAEWTDPGDRVVVSGLVTRFGPLGYRIESEPSRIVVTIDALRELRQVAWR